MARRHSDTGNLVYDCARCGDTLNPTGSEVQDTATEYVEAATERNPYKRSVAVALKHTQRTKVIRDDLVDRHNLTVAQANNVHARNDPTYMPTPSEVPDSVSIPDAWKNGAGVAISVPDSEYNRVVDVDPEDAKHDPSVVRVDADTIEVDEPARLLVCVDCVKDGDTLLWPEVSAR